MANQIEEIEKPFLSKANYERQVGWTTILFETSEDDGMSNSYRRMCDNGELKDEKLKNNLRLYFSLMRLENDINKKVEETLEHFFKQIDIPSDKIHRRQYFLSYYSKLQETSDNIWKLFGSYIPIDIERVQHFLNSIAEEYYYNFKDLQISEPKDWESLLKDMESIYRAQVKFAESIGVKLLDGLVELTENEIHFIRLVGILSCVNEAGAKILGKNAELLDFKGKIKFEHGFPVLLLDEDELDILFERIKARAEVEKQEKRNKAKLLIVEILSPLNGYHYNQRKRIEDDDFKRLCEYSIAYFVDDSLPKNYDPIVKTNISAQSVRHIFYQLYDKINTSSLLKIEREAVVDFMKKVFYNMFKETETTTLVKKFAEKPPKGFPD